MDTLEKIKKIPLEFVADRIDRLEHHGWRCPVCGRGLAPHVSECPCVAEHKLDEILKKINKDNTHGEVEYFFEWPPPEA